MNYEYILAVQCLCTWARTTIGSARDTVYVFLIR